MINKLMNQWFDKSFCQVVVVLRPMFFLSVFYLSIVGTFASLFIDQQVAVYADYVFLPINFVTNGVICCSCGISIDIA